MNLQHQLNKLSLIRTPRISAIIEGAASYEANQMREYTLQKMMDSYTSITDMTEHQLDEFQDNVIADFKYKNWLSQ